MKRIALTITILVTFLAGSVSVLIASWAGAAAPAGASGLRGDYFGDPNLASLKLTRNDAAVNFEWRTGAVAAGVGPDNFSARWTGALTPRFSETYTFFTQSDDGVRLWVDGRLLIDDWTRHGLTERKGTIALQAGRAYDLRLEYFEYNVDATVRLLWSSQSQPKEIVPQSRLAPPGATAPTSTTRPAPSATATPAPPPAPSATATSAPAAGVYQVKPGDNWIEAEQPTSGMSGAWAIQGDASASGGRYVVTTAASGGTLEYRFQTDYAGPIYVWLRAIGAPGTTRPVKVQLDGGPQDSATIDGAAWTWNLDDDAVY